MMLVQDYNVYESFAMTDLSLGTRDGTVYRDIASWRATTGLDAHSLVGSPGLVNPNSTATGSARLTKGSICRNAGRVGGVATGAPTDIGAWGGGATKIGADLAFLRPNGPSGVS